MVLWLQTRARAIHTYRPPTREILPIYERNVYAQHGEDGVIESVFNAVGTTNKFFVEIGCDNGEECNTRLLEEHGWQGFKIDKDHRNVKRRIYQHTVTPVNIRGMLNSYGCLLRPDFLSIDIDTVDWHVLHSILKFYQPRLICTEYNGGLGFEADLTVPIDHFLWDGSRYQGASYMAFSRLGEHFGYTVIWCEYSGTNLFMLRSELCPPDFNTDSKWLPAATNHGPDLLRREWHDTRRYLP